MKQQNDGWEFYTDTAGRRHWRWPAATPQLGAGITSPDVGPRQRVGSLPQKQYQAQPAPWPLRIR